MGTCRHFGSLLLFSVMMVGCSSAGNLGIVTRASADNANRLKAGVAFEEIGPAEGSACRHFVIAAIPFGNSSFSKALDNALEHNGGDALINVTVTSSLYGFIPIYNVYSFTCTSVQGIAVKFKPLPLSTAAEKNMDSSTVAQQR
jgi:hypothetical protein